MRRTGLPAVIGFVSGVVAMQPGLAQGCAMCRSTLEAQKETITSALQLGILVLLVPPLAIMGTFLYIVFRKEDDPLANSPGS